MTTKTEQSRILVVDDNEQVRTSLRAVLEFNLFRVTTAANVAEALHLIDTEPFDVLLSDLHMPEAGDGYTVVSAMHHTNPDAITLVYTGYPELEQAMDAILLQADEVLVKPMAMPTLVALIQEKLENRGTRKARNVERVASILERDALATITDWLARVEREDELTCVPLSKEQRTGHLPKLIEELVHRLRVPTAPTNRLTSGISEAEAIKGAQQGDHECFNSLYTLHKRRVYSLCLRMSRNIEEAEDFTQEAFLLLHRKIATFRGDSAFSTWLHRLTVNVVLMHLRKKRLKEISLDEAMDPFEEDGPKRDFGFEDQVLAGSIDRINLERAFESLPPGYRVTFALHDIEGYEHHEIAEMLGRSIGNSKSQLHMARMKLRGLLMITGAGKNRHRNMRNRKEATIEVTSRLGATSSRYSVHVA